jgi:hypothetical protein
MQYWDDVSNMGQGLYAGENPADGAELSYYLSQPARSVRLIVRDRGGRVIRELAGSTTPGFIHRTTWDLRHVPPPVSSAGGAGGEEGEGGPGVPRIDPRLQRPVPAHDIGVRGPYVSPGTYLVTLSVDGDTTSRQLEVRADPMLPYTLAQHRAREAFLLSVQAAQIDVDRMLNELRARRTAATGADSTRLVALQRRLTVGRIAPRTLLGSIARAFNGSGAQQGSFAPPSAVHRRMLADARAEIAVVAKELRSTGVANSR